MNNRSLLSCRNEIKQNFMAHSYAGYLRTEIIYVNPIDPYARCAGEFRSLKKKKVLQLCRHANWSSKTEKYVATKMRRERLHRKIEKEFTGRDKRNIIIESKYIFRRRRKIVS